MCFRLLLPSSYWSFSWRSVTVFSSVDNSPQNPQKLPQKALLSASQRPRSLPIFLFLLFTDTYQASLPAWDPPFPAR